MAVHVRNVTLKARMMDGDALLTPSILDDIVSAVLDELDARKSDEQSRAQDTAIAAKSDAYGDSEGAS